MPCVIERMTFSLQLIVDSLFTKLYAQSMYVHTHVYVLICLQINMYILNMRMIVMLKNSDTVVACEMGNDWK